MSKNLIYKIIIVVGAVAAAVLWLLSEVNAEVFGFFNFSWAVAVLSGAAGISYLLKGIFEKNVSTLKKISICFSVVFLVVAVVCIAFAIAMPENFILPIIAVIVTAGVLIGVLVVGGKKWDQGDNKNANYKNYYERKKDEEKDKDKLEK